MGHDFKFEVVLLSEVSEAEEMAGAEETPVVLVVDDEPLIVNSLAAILAHAGLKVMRAYNGRTALEIAMESAPHLLLTDVAMPGMNGVDLAMAVTSAMPECRVLLFSGHASMLDLTRARAAGFDFPVMAKPLHPVAMLKRVFEALAQPAGGPVTRPRQVIESHPLPMWLMPQFAS